MAQSYEKHPIISIIYLLLLVVAGAFAFSILSVIIGFVFYGPDFMKELMVIDSGEGDLEFVKLFQTLTSIGTFIVPALLLRRIERRPDDPLFTFAFPSRSQLLLLAIGIMLFSGPLMELTALINKQMELPEALRSVEEWMKAKEAQMAHLTEKLLYTTSIGGLLFNLFMIAVIPAIGEELLFRGCLQPIFYRWTRNPHVAIWITAILFSAIHMQFYGFLPRMLMGAAFGYMLYWGKSIWLPIIAHFVNNAAAVIYTFVMLQQGKSYQEIASQSIESWPLYIVSVVVVTALSIRFYRLSQEQQTELKPL